MTKGDLNGGPAKQDKHDKRPVDQQPPKGPSTIENQEAPPHNRNATPSQAKPRSKR